MTLHPKQLIAVLFLTFITNQVSAQEADPEVVRMQENAKSEINRGNYNDAIMLYHQAIKLSPNDVSLRRDLAYAYYLNGALEQGRKIITEILATEYADELSFQVGAAIESKLSNHNKARNILTNGLKKYPNSALLYYNRGNLLLLDNKTKQALENFQSGIKADPSYPANYLALAKQLESTKPLWALYYYEIFINLEPFTKRTAEAKSALYKTYIAYFQKSNNTTLPSFGNQMTLAKNANFETTIQYLIDKNVAAISNGISTESLAMLRTRIILDWNLNYINTFPYSLFSYQDKLLKNGMFEAYNQWLFGANENSRTYSTWIKTHSEIYSKFEQWMSQNPLRTNSSDPQAF